MKTPVRLFLFFAITAVSVTATAAGDDVTLSTDGSNIEFLSDKVAETDAFTLTITSPDGRIWREEYAGFQLPEVDLRSAFDGRLPDGQYHYEILPHSAPLFGTIAPELRGLETRADMISSADDGTFTIDNGQVLDPNIMEASTGAPASMTGDSGARPTQNDDGSDDETIQATVLTNADGVIRNSLCVGFDCPNSPSFGADTIRLQENNLRIHFEDTSSTGSFPTVDWELRANDQANGGANHFSIINRDNGRTPFRVDADASTNALRVASGNRVGFGTGNPVVELHSADGDTPTLRLEQNGSSGFSPQTWDVAGNETNFFVRDTTNGSTLPLRIRPGAPSNSIHIAPSGDVGIGTAFPAAPVHIQRSDNTARVRIEDTGTTGAQTMLWMLTNGHPRIRFDDLSQADVRWQIGTSGNEGDSESFIIAKVGTGGAQARVFHNGDLEIAGTLTQGSSRTIKERITELSAETVLARLEGLTVHEWSYQKVPESRHVGPMAEDFHAAFKLGHSDKHIAPGDMAGVALAAAKALNEKLNAENAELRERHAMLEERLQRLEALLPEHN